jgi:hypothetical protein
MSSEQNKVVQHWKNKNKTNVENISQNMQRYNFLRYSCSRTNFINIAKPIINYI